MESVSSLTACSIKAAVLATTYFFPSPMHIANAHVPYSPAGGFGNNLSYPFRPKSSRVPVLPASFIKPGGRLRPSESRICICPQRIESLPMQTLCRSVLKESDRSNRSTSVREAESRTSVGKHRTGKQMSTDIPRRPASDSLSFPQLQGTYLLQIITNTICKVKPRMNAMFRDIS